MSYKALQENRQLGAEYHENAQTQTEALAIFAKLFREKSDPIVIIADASLYTEELEAIATFATKIAAVFVIPMACYHDESFGDDWLRSSDRSANVSGVKSLGIATTMPTGDIGLLISFDHPQAYEYTTTQTVSLQTQRRENEDEERLILPLAVYTESSGSLTNRDGITQWSAQAIHRNQPIPTVIEWIESMEKSIGGVS